MVLGLVGGSLIVAHSGFATSPRRGGPSTFVPVPEAYVLAATMYAMSFFGMLALLRNRQASRVTMAIASALYLAAAALLANVIAPALNASRSPRSRSAAAEDAAPPRPQRVDTSTAAAEPSPAASRAMAWSV